METVSLCDAVREKERWNKERGGERRRRRRKMELEGMEGRRWKNKERVRREDIEGLNY